MNISTHFSQLSAKTYSLQSPTEAKGDGLDDGKKPTAEAAPGVQVTLSQASISASRISASRSNEASTLTATHQVDGGEAVTRSKAPNNTYASTILSAIDAQLGRDTLDGASPKALQSRLEAGLEGFLQGFDEAFEQLSAMSEFSPDIRSDVLQTKEQVLAGLAAKADELGLDKSAIDLAQKGLAEQQATQATQTIQSRAETTQPVEQGFALPSLTGFNGFAAKENTFAFYLTTADGDKIEILASALKAGEIQYGEEGSKVTYAEKNAFAFSVEGELDEGELKAINDLLNQVNTVAESFFDGDLEQAFEQAINMGFDANEIKDFSLVLTQTSTTRIQDAYENPQASKQPSANQPLVDLGKFMIELDKANLLAEQMKQDLAIVGQLADRLNDARNGEQESHNNEGSKQESHRTSISEFIQRINEFNSDSDKS